MSSQFEHDTQLLDALDRARLDTEEATPPAPAALTDRLRDLCTRHDLPADDGLLARAAAVFLAQSSTTLPTPTEAPKEPEKAALWRRPASKSELEAARAQAEAAVNQVNDPEPKRKLALIFYVPAALTLPPTIFMHIHAPVLGALLSAALLAIAPWLLRKLQRRIQRARVEALDQVRSWLTVRDDEEDLRRRIVGAKVNLMSYAERQTPEDLHRWSLAPANHALLAAIADSKVPLLMGDARTLDANMESVPALSREGQARAWREGLSLFARQVRTGDAGALPWKRYDRVDRLSGRITRVARAQSTPFELGHPYSGLQRLALTAVQEPTEEGETLWGLWITLAVGQLGLNLKALRVRVDDQPVEFWPGRAAGDASHTRDSLWLFQNPAHVLERLQGARQLHVEVPAYNNSSVVEVFDVTGLDWDAPGEDLALASSTDESLRSLRTFAVRSRC